LWLEDSGASFSSLNILLPNEKGRTNIKAVGVIGLQKELRTQSVKSEMGAEEDSRSQRICIVGAG
jgi:hypothetical protein